jgi:pimeloyl-ACP methyl ester carboxylesterase/DNA-binding CsgD family transcriptional regulator
MKSSDTLKQDISFVTSNDGTRIACASMGRGTTIVRAAHWLTHISRDLESPVWRHWLAELSSYGQLVRYDLRGCGLSSRNVPEISFEAWLANLEAVTSKLEEPFTLLGMSQGAALSIAYAIKHPERVKQLVLVGGYAKGLLSRDQSDRTQVEAATQTMDILHRIDVSAVAAELNVPTLVLHARGDRRIPFEQGRELAMSIPGAEFVPLSSNNHVLLETEPAWSVFCSALRGFLGDGIVPSWADVGLTAAEREVLGLVAKGLSNPDIAAQLEKSEKTVRNQVSSLLEKTGLSTRSELIVRTLSGQIGQAP